MTIKQAKENNVSAYMYAGIKYPNAFESIIKSICEYEQINVETLKKRCRKREIVECRQIIYYFCDKYKIKTQQKITEYFNQDHATLIFAKKQIENYVTTSPIFRMKIDHLESEIIKYLDI